MKQSVMEQVENIFIKNKAEFSKLQAKTNIIKIIGIGGAGLNILHSMIQNDLKGVTFIAAETDFKALKTLPNSTIIRLGAETSKGTGTNSVPEKGSKAAQESLKEIVGSIEGADMLILVAGLGGGTGTGSTQIIAEAAKTLGIFTVGFFTLPFTYEGKARAEIAEKGIAELNKRLNGLIPFPNDELNKSAPAKVSLFDVFKVSDDAICEAVVNIIDLLTNKSPIETSIVHKLNKEKNLDQTAHVRVKSVQLSTMSPEQKKQDQEDAEFLLQSRISSIKSSNSSNFDGISAKRKLLEAENEALNRRIFQTNKVDSNTNDTAIICPGCGAKNAYHAGNKGFGLGKAAVGGLLLGPVGLLGGLIGSRGLVVQCIKCGKKWTP